MSSTFLPSCLVGPDQFLTIALDMFLHCRSYKSLDASNPLIIASASGIHVAVRSIPSPLSLPHSLPLSVHVFSAYTRLLSPLLPSPSLSTLS